MALKIRTSSKVDQGQVQQNPTFVTESIPNGVVNHIVGVAIFIACMAGEWVSDMSQKMLPQALEECLTLLTFCGVMLFNVTNKIMRVREAAIAQCTVMSKPLTGDGVIQEEKGEIVPQVLDQLGRLCMQSRVDSCHSDHRLVCNRP